MTEEFSSKKDDLIKKVEKIHWWEWIPVLGGYLYFARINFTKNNFIKPIRKSIGSKIKYYQMGLSLVSLPFAIWTIVDIARNGWGFHYQAIALIIIFSIQFFSPLPIRKLFLKGLNSTSKK